MKQIAMVAMVMVCGLVAGLSQEQAALPKHGETNEVAQLVERARLEGYAAGVAAMRNEVREEIAMLGLDHEREVAAGLLLAMQQRRVSSPELKAQCWEKVIGSLSNRMSIEVTAPVKLYGVVKRIDPWGAMVEAPDGNETWPVADGKGGQIQKGYFFVRGKGRRMHEQINGVGVEPMPVVFTNRVGNVVFFWSYEVKPEKTELIRD